MAQISNILAAGVSFLIGLSIGLVLLIIGLVKNIEDLIILGALFLGLLLVLVVFVLIYLLKRRRSKRSHLFRGSYRSKGHVVSYMCSKPVTSLLFFRRALLIAWLSDELIKSKLEQTFGHF